MEGEWVCYRGGSVGAGVDRTNTLQLRAQLVGMGLLTEPEVRDFLRLLDDPEFIGSLPLLIAGYGRRPAD
jgi:hypothetical protein